MSSPTPAPARRSYRAAARVALLSVAAGVAMLFTAPAAHAQQATVTSINDSGPGTLRDAIEQGAAEITFAPGLSGTISLQSALPDLTSDVSIAGPGAATIAVRRDDLAPEFRIFRVTDGAEARISGLTIANGIRSGNSGGAIEVRSSNLELDGVVVSESFTGRNGGAISIRSDSALVVRRSHIHSNHASQSGGGISSTGAGGVLTLIDSTVSDNSVEREDGLSSGGGIHAPTSVTSLEIVNSTITANSATGSAGGLVIGAPSSIRNSTIAANSAPLGANVRRVGSGHPPAVLASTIVAGPLGGGANCDVLGDSGFASGGHNLASDASCDFTATADISGADPLLGALADNGGPTPTMALDPLSPAVGKGVANGLTADQRGLPRPFLQPAIPVPTGGDGTDIGAYELQEHPPTPAEPAARPAQLRIGRALVRGRAANRRVVVAGRLAPQAAGERLVIRYRTPRGQVRMRPRVAGDGRYRVARKLRGGLRRAAAGRLNVRFEGNAQLRPARAQLRASRRAVRLRLGDGQPRVRNEGRRLVVRGSVRRAARGRALVRLEFTRDDGTAAAVTDRARVNNRGRFRSRIGLPAAAREHGAHLTVVHRGRGRLHGQRIGRALPGS